ncbi:MAG: hypothetical protein NC420_12310 [Eubacterium sp.]|nr:hypothetical protein [Eubacterium sp.]
MNSYEKPLVLANEELAEGVYAASGAVAENGSGSDNGPGCDSKYVNGVFHSPDYTKDGTEGYLAQFGCLGCPAFTYAGGECGLLTHYVESGNASSYDVDNGNRKPSWEKKGYGPNDPVTDWNM